MNSLLIEKAFTAPINNARSKLLLVGLAFKSVGFNSVNVSPISLCNILSLQADSIECVINHLDALDGKWFDYEVRESVSGGALIVVDLTRLAEFDSFGGVA